jgi:hypothetical protein
LYANEGVPLHSVKYKSNNSNKEQQIYFVKAKYKCEFRWHKPVSRILDKLNGELNSVFIHVQVAAGIIPQVTFQFFTCLANSNGRRSVMRYKAQSMCPVSVLGYGCTYSERWCNQGCLPAKSMPGDNSLDNSMLAMVVFTKEVPQVETT